MLSNLSTESRVQILMHFVVVFLHGANHISPLQRVIRLLVFDTGTIMLVKNQRAGEADCLISDVCANYGCTFSGKLANGKYLNENKAKERGQN